ncbi:hypothetical protein FJM65_07985 [Pontibacter mangrovi]|uniref:Uncharacterized protein n=1 Tax=Pontibacter mangrovi TaxID=2589816 RepID=A0A501W8U3_9BACT|nr:hypothetical protein FJM65_07985 [Pontibacter mangrovi]
MARRSILKGINTDGFPTKMYITTFTCRGEKLTSVVRVTLVPEDHVYLYSTSLKVYKGRRLLMETMGFRSDTLALINTISKTAEV